MSKKRASTQGNTLLNYFQSPKSKPRLGSSSNSESESKNETPKKAPIIEVDSEMKNEVLSDDDEDIIKSSQSRKRIRAFSDSDSDNENSKSVLNVLKTSRKDKKLKLESSPSPPQKKVETSISPVEKHRWTHEKLDFLKPENIRDKNKKKLGDPNYDPKTLYVPENYLNSITPAMRQWWEIKSEHTDCVIFFKVGKFYELYHMDATVGVNNLGFSYMKGEFAHSGFPEIAYGRMASSLIEQGFKVLRVEQTETPEMMADRCKGRKVTKFDKVVRREVCQISSRGATVYGAQLSDAKNPLPCYMISIAEKQIAGFSSRYGVCFVDTSIGIFNLSEFIDDKHCSKLLVLLAQNPPGLILTESGHSSLETNDILKRRFGNVRRETLKSQSQFYSGSTTLEKLHFGSYFKSGDGDFHWPNTLKGLISNGAPKPEYELCLKALGGCLWYLKDSQIDAQLLSIGKFNMYEPLIGSGVVNQQEYMVLDSVTIDNLKLLGGKGTLQGTLDLCSTPFGKRLLQQWICRPLCNVEIIEKRQEAVSELLNNSELLHNTRGVLKKLPDLERQVAKIHTFGNKYCAENHPDSRAVLYEAKTYSKRKILDLLTTLRGFEKAQEISQIFNGCQAKLLKSITQHPPEGMFNDLSEDLNYFKEAFDHVEAEKEGQILPQTGVEDDYDNIEDEIKEINQEISNYLDSQKKKFGSQQVCYFGSDKKRYQLEIPDNKCHKVTDEYQLEGTKKGKNPAKRYSTPTTKMLLSKMMKAESERNKIIQDLNRRVFHKFSDRYDGWDQVTQCLAILDVLCSLAEYARVFSQDICQPKILPISNNPHIKIETGRHPCIPNIDNFVPNTTELGTKDHPSVLLLTGPNMGGKSTLMRQVALINIMAQIGSYIPAVSCELTITDRIFTRLGAHDDIIKGQSTFLVEATEASAILQHATRQSLVLIDELGRGTSTHDGNAIATSYLQKLTDVKCRVMYSTHYHNLVDHFEGHGDVQLGHMECLVENEGDDAKETVVFLYQMARGVCPKSYGFNVAKLAGLPQSIISRSRELARELESLTKTRELMKNVFMCDDVLKIRELLI
nr:probable DNA mismatch repair protein Msh6 [Onthophagus taurus]